MKIFADYHTHTQYSHGKGTIEENVAQAIRRGLKEIGISDHGPKHMTYGVKKKELKKMREEIDKINQSTDQIQVKLGVEANIISMDGQLDVDDEILEWIDILLAGFHFGAMPVTLKDGIGIHVNNFLAKYIPSIEKEARYHNTQALIKAINRYPIDIITHPGAKANIDTAELARAAAKRGTALEINSSHGHLTTEYIRVAMKEGVKFVISSDAHRPEDVGNVQAGMERAIAAGLEIQSIINAEE